MDLARAGGGYVLWDVIRSRISESCDFTSASSAECYSCTKNEAIVASKGADQADACEHERGGYPLPRASHRYLVPLADRRDRNHGPPNRVTEVVNSAAGHADPRTTRRYDRARHNLDRHPTYLLVGMVG